jgi:acetyl esterase/lipase
MRVDEPRAVPRRTALAALAALTAAGCSKLAFFAANIPAAFGAYTRRPDVPYGAEPRQRLDVYAPSKPGARPSPLVVFWHGGRWEFGDKDEYRFVGAALAAAGYAAVLPNYRHYPQVKMAGFMQDAARATEWAVAHAGEFHADPARLYLMGHSSGAHMAVLLALDTRYFVRIDAAIPPIAGVVGLSGPYDFLPLTESDLQDMFGPPNLYALSQPINFVRDDAPPMLLAQGEKDRTVAPKNSRNLAAALAAHDVPVTLLMFPDLNHADTVAALSEPARGRAPILAAIEDFVGATDPADIRPRGS